tara:strand:+ start:294 stop:743 length:450 start_codon:yes stop_codon:yes gene_type:complete
MSGELIRFLEKVGAKTRFGQNAHTLCGAKAKRTGLPCRQPAMKNGRCRLHGGKTPAYAERHTMPADKRKWSTWEKDVRRRVRREENYTIKQFASCYDWHVEEALLQTGLLHRAKNDIERHQLRQAFARYDAGEMPWIAWHNTLLHLGLA